MNKGKTFRFICSQLKYYSMFTYDNVYSTLTRHIENKESTKQSFKTLTNS